MSDLFEAASKGRRKPLAAELRPSGLDDVVGQRHILGPGTLLRRRVADRRIGTAILYGPSGIGKTTIALAIGASMGKEFRQLHPATSGVADMKAVADEARMKEILLFVDEIHRFSATQQDHLLGLTEDGVFDLIGATTGNPYHVLTPALVSRGTIFKLEPLTPAEMEQVIVRAVAVLRREGTVVEIGPHEMAMLSARAGGDARRAMNVLEDLIVGSRPGHVQVTREMVEEIYAASPIPYDRGGDAHYDVISAFVKSMRGSDPDATLFWLARLIHAGEDPRYIARRIMIHASEDVGLADNTALQTAVAAMTAVEKIGYPEAQIVLAHAALHVARAPKSNSAYRGIATAMAFVKENPHLQVPAHLRDTHYKGAAKLGHGGYASPHAEPSGWNAQLYAPEVSPGDFYQSDDRNGQTFEGRADRFWGNVSGRVQPALFRGRDGED